MSVLRTSDEESLDHSGLSAIPVGRGPIGIGKVGRLKASEMARRCAKIGTEYFPQ